MAGKIYGGRHLDEHRKMKELVLAETAVIRSAKRLISLKRYGDAMPLLESVTRKQLSTFDDGNQSTYFMLYGRCLYELGFYQRAILKSRIAARLASRSGKDAIYAEVKCQIGRIRLRQGQYIAATEEFNESYVFYRRVRDFSSMLVPLCSLAQAHFIAGNLTPARQALQNCIRGSRKYLSLSHTTLLERNLARVLLFMGELAQAKSIIDSVSNSVSSCCLQVAEFGLASIIRT